MIKKDDAPDTSRRNSKFRTGNGIRRGIEFVTRSSYKYTRQATNHLTIKLTSRRSSKKMTSLEILHEIASSIEMSVYKSPNR